jgi:gamma-glutamyl-gamma-aminobutyrate hydrolase PuuD
MKVYVVNDMCVENMFESEGHTCVNNVAKADLVCFTGGEDVSPFLYGERKHHSTWSNLQRDLREMGIYDVALNAGKPMVGICRGGQFLNVMCGGGLWQDVCSHAIHGTHMAIRMDMDNEEGRYVQVTSTHHQMMRPSSEGCILLQANFVGSVVSIDMVDSILGIESVYYSKQKCLCFQPHPEYGSVSESTKEVFFDFLNKYLLGGE